MFRSLATRLVALYVLAAFGLIVVAGGAVTAFALSTFVIGTVDAQGFVAREAPDLVATYATRHRSLADAAPDVVRRLSRPGLRVAVFTSLAGGGYRMEATDDPLNGEPGGHVVVFGTRPGERPPFELQPVSRGFEGPPHGSRPPGPPPPGFEHGPPPMGLERGSPLPFGLGFLFHIRPRHVAVPGGMVAVWVDPRPFQQTISAFWTAMIPLGLLSLVAAWLLGRFITSQALRPLVETTAALHQFAEGDFTPRAIVSAERNEIGELVSAYNGAVEQVTRAFEERRLAEVQMRQFVADAGHELRTPLTVIMGFIDVMRRRAGGADAATSARILETMILESRRMRALIDKLIVLARLDTADVRALEDVGLGDAAAAAIASLAPVDPQSRLILRVACDPVVRADRPELHEAVTNILENALKYAPASLVEVTVAADETHAILTVVDHGEGLSVDECSHVFDRFYRGHQRGESEGFGLGLAIAKRAVERAGGEIAVVSAPGEGCRFTISFPRLAQRTRALRPA